jgi:translation initiation factor 4A
MPRIRNNNFDNDEKVENDEKNIKMEMEELEKSSNSSVSSKSVEEVVKEEVVKEEEENDDDDDFVSVFDSWDDEHVNIKPKLLRGIYSYGFENPSPIQKKAIIPILKNKDIIAQAQSGTGKTGAFVVSSLQKVDEKVKSPQVLILSPTRELAYQTYNVCKELSQYLKKIHTKLLVGGTSTEEDKNDLNENPPQIVIGCPGRIHDMMRRGYLDTKSLKLLVMDEADEMLSVGFKDQIYNIFQHLNNKIQIGLFSATMPKEVESLAEKIMRNPMKILVKSEMLTLEGIEQYYIALDDDHVKYEVIKDLFQTVSLTQCIIYCNSVKRVQNLTDAMSQDNFPVICIHSGMNDAERREAYKTFKSGQKRVLISSDVTARGIDVQQLSVVINFDIPKSVHTYLHRIGRSGRWGRKGMSINFVTRRDMIKLKEIESWYNTNIEELPTNYAEKMRCL